MKFQSQTSIFLLFCFTLFFMHGPPATAHVLSSHSASGPSIVPLAVRDSFASVCTSASPCKGDMTNYSAGLGACGATSNGNVDRIAALSHFMMGSLSNTNPYCGRTITIRCLVTSKTTTATVLDKCIGCTTFFDVDLSNAAFELLDDLSVGRTQAEWWFN
jgi:hypothetical protein